MDISMTFSISYWEFWALHIPPRGAECGEQASVDLGSKSPGIRLAGVFGRLLLNSWEKESGESLLSEKVEAISAQTSESVGNPKAGISSSFKDEEGPSTARAWGTGLAF